jgi:hypothetical protein
VGLLSAVVPKSFQWQICNYSYLHSIQNPGRILQSGYCCITKVENAINPFGEMARKALVFQRWFPSDGMVGGKNDNQVIDHPFLNQNCPPDQPDPMVSTGKKMTC